MPYTYCYARASTSRQEHSPEQQIAVCKAWYERNTGLPRKWSDRDTAETVLPPWRTSFVDHVTGSKKFNDRADASLLLKTVCRGDFVLVAELDRVGRKCHDIVSTIHELTERGVRVRVLNFMGGEMDPCSRIGQLVIGVLAWAAETERENIRERAIRGIARNKAMGARLGNCRLGFRATSVPPLFQQPDPIVQHALDRCYQMFISGTSIREAWRIMFKEPGLRSFHNVNKPSGVVPCMSAIRKHVMLRFDAERNALTMQNQDLVDLGLAAPELTGAAASA